eukprot:763566-Hanusia_phi.AAC.3
MTRTDVSATTEEQKETAILNLTQQMLPYHPGNPLSGHQILPPGAAALKTAAALAASGGGEHQIQKIGKHTEQLSADRTLRRPVGSPGDVTGPGIVRELPALDFSDWQKDS